MASGATFHRWSEIRFGLTVPLVLMDPEVKKTRLLTKYLGVSCLFYEGTGTNCEVQVAIFNVQIASCELCVTS
jgi:hypothetical protein